MQQALFSLKVPQDKAMPLGDVRRNCKRSSIFFFASSTGNMIRRVANHSVLQHVLQQRMLLLT
jgi:hypothetical protein